MENTVNKHIRNVISHSKSNEVFMTSSFPKYDTAYVTDILNKLEKEGILMYIAKGIFVKARKTQFGVLYPSISEIVYQIAKRDHAKIIPTGQTAENNLGFSTQVPMNTSFLTSGTPRTLKIGSRTVKLKHGVPKNFAYKGNVLPVLVQALRSIGKENISNKDEQLIKSILSANPENETFEHDILLAPAWIKQIIIKNKNNNEQMD